MVNYERNRSLGHLANWMARLFRKDIHRRLQPLGLMPAHIPVLMALADGSALSQTDLGKWSQTEQPALAGVLVRMEKAGLLHRIPHQHDGRVSLFEMTEMAKEKLPKLFQALDEGNDRARGNLTDDEYERLILATHHVIRNLGGVPGIRPANDDEG